MAKQGGESGVVSVSDVLEFVRGQYLSLGGGPNDLKVEEAGGKVTEQEMVSNHFGEKGPAGDDDGKFSSRDWDTNNNNNNSQQAVSSFLSMCVNVFRLFHKMVFV